MSVIQLPSTKDKVMFTRAVQERYRKLTVAYIARGERLGTPRDIELAIQTVLPMHARYNREQYFHTVEEERAEKQIANWLVKKVREYAGKPKADDLQFSF